MPLSSADGSELGSPAGSLDGSGSYVSAIIELVSIGGPCFVMIAISLPQAKNSANNIETPFILIMLLFAF